MKAVVKYTRAQVPEFRVVDVPIPVCEGPNSVLIGIESIGICMSDIHVLHGSMQMPDANIVGHEYSGKVIEVGDAVKSVKPGDRVVGELAVGACGKCRMCLSGRYELCPEKRPPGWVSPGVYAEYTVMDDWLLHHIPVEVDYDVAALTEPMAVCVYGCFERASVAPEDYVVVYGMGSIGLLTLVSLIDAGNRRVVCVTPTKRGTARLELARKLGASLVIGSEEDVKGRIRDDTGGQMADVVIDCSGAPMAINQGIDILRRDGTFVALGLASSTSISIDYNAAVLKPIKMVFSCTSSHASWVRSLQILSRQADRVRGIITDRRPLTDWRLAYDALENREAIKGVLYNASNGTDDKSHDLGGKR